MYWWDKNYQYWSVYCSHFASARRRKLRAQGKATKATESILLGKAWRVEHKLVSLCPGGQQTPCPMAFSDAVLTGRLESELAITFARSIVKWTYRTPCSKLLRICSQRPQSIQLRVGHFWVQDTVWLHTSHDCKVDRDCSSGQGSDRKIPPRNRRGRVLQGYCGVREAQGPLVWGRKWRGRDNGISCQCKDLLITLYGVQEIQVMK